MTLENELTPEAQVEAAKTFTQAELDDVLKSRLDRERKKFEGEKTELQAQLDAMRKQTQSEKIRNEFNKVATGANIAYLDDAIALADLSAVSIGEDGSVIGMDDVVSSLVGSKPFLVARQPVSIGQPTNHGKESTERSTDQMLAEAAAKAKASGKPEDRAAYTKLKRELGK